MVCVVVGVAVVLGTGTGFSWGVVEKTGRKRRSGGAEASGVVTLGGVTVFMR